jgi:two-component system OmpR family response regulator
MMADAKVLIVDDDLEYLDVMADRMEGRGYQVEKAGTGMDALEKLDAAIYDAIVLDMMMPGMDGLETLKRIREKNPDLQVILLTGHATVQSGVEAIKMGALDFLEKPAEIEKLTALIDKAKDNRLLLVEENQEDMIKETLRKYGA